MLKNDRMKEKEKKKDVEGLLGPTQEERFALLVNLGRKITDWGQEDRALTSTEFFLFIYFLFVCQFYLIVWYVLLVVCMLHYEPVLQSLKAL